MPKDKENKVYLKQEYEFPILVKTRKDIIAEIRERNGNETADICNFMVKDIEKTAADLIKNQLTALIPYVGRVRINVPKKQFIDSKPLFNLLRRNLSKEEYKIHLILFRKHLEVLQARMDKTRDTIRELKQFYKWKYRRLTKESGLAYANMFILSMYLMEEVKFDEEFENKYRKLKLKEELDKGYEDAVDKYINLKYGKVDTNEKEFLKTNKGFFKSNKK